MTSGAGTHELAYIHTVRLVQYLSADIVDAMFAVRILRTANWTDEVVQWAMGWGALSERCSGGSHVEIQLHQHGITMPIIFRKR